MKKTLLFLIIVLVLCSVTYGAKQTFNYPDTGGQLYIKYVPITTLKINTDFTFNFHIFNFTGTPINNSIKCEFHLYNSTGNHIYVSNTFTQDHTFDYEFFVGGNNFSKVGDYAYIVQCHNTTWGVGAFDSIPIGVTLDGKPDEPDADAALPVIFFMLFGIIGLFVLGFTGKFNKHEIVNLVLKRGCFVIAIMIMMYTATLLLTIFTHANLDLLGKEMVFLMTWIGWAGYVASVYLVIQTLFDIFRLRKEGNNKKICEVNE